MKEKQKNCQPLRIAGLGTVEVVLIIAVLLAVALIFREQLQGFAQDLMDKVFDHALIDQL